MNSDKNIKYNKICASASEIGLLLPELLHFARKKIWKLVGGNFIMLASLLKGYEIQNKSFGHC